ncbi:MAG TPA: DUF4160 domain-containing protein [Pirellulales bacterium]|jgi:hypothetical protein
MPTISRFFGVTIRMYYDDHGTPHFHAYYGNDAAKIEINTLKIVEGKLPRRAIGFILEWALEHRQELLANWELCETHLPLNPIAPLE